MAASHLPGCLRMSQHVVPFDCEIPNDELKPIGSPRPSVTIPVTWNDADRDAGIDWWIANATYWRDQCQQVWQTRDMVSDLQRRIDAALRMIQAVDPTSGRGRMNTFLNDLRNVLDQEVRP